MRVKAGIVSGAEDAVIDWQAILLADHFTDYRGHREAKGLNAARISNTASRLSRETGGRLRIPQSWPNWNGGRLGGTDG